MSNPFASQPKSVTSATTTTPWAPQGTQLQHGFDRARTLLNAPGPNFFPGSTVSPFSGTQNQAHQMATSRATQGSPLTAASKGHTMDVIGGKFLGQDNPHLNNVFAGIQNRVQPAVNSQFMNSGRQPGGSNQWADTMSRAMTQELAPYAFQTYGAERQAQEDANQFAPQLAAGDWQDIGMLDTVGQAQTQQGQRNLDDQIARWNFQEEKPQNKLNDFMSLISGAYGGSSTSTIPYYQPSMFSQLLGGGLGLAGAASGLGWRPF